MRLPDRYFPALRADPRFVEGLLIPFHDHGKPIGTVWIVAKNLAAILFAADSLKVRENLSASAMQSLNLIERQAQHLRGMVDDLMDVARITRGNLELRK